MVEAVRKPFGWVRVLAAGSKSTIPEERRDRTRSVDSSIDEEALKERTIVMECHQRHCNAYIKILGTNDGQNGNNSQSPA